MTTTWTSRAIQLSTIMVSLIPADIAAGEYQLIVGLYDINDAAARLPVGDGSYVELSTIEVRGGS